MKFIQGIKNIQANINVQQIHIKPKQKYHLIIEKEEGEIYDSLELFFDEYAQATHYAEPWIEQGHNVIIEKW